MAYSTLKMAKAYYGDSWKDIYTKPNKLSSTLDKLYAWEKKLYKEVKVCVRGHEPTKKGGKKEKKKLYKSDTFFIQILGPSDDTLFIYLFISVYSLDVLPNSSSCKDGTPSIIMFVMSFPMAGMYLQCMNMTRNLRTLLQMHGHE